MPRFTKLSDFLPELAHPKDVNGNPSVYVLHYPGFTLAMNVRGFLSLFTEDLERTGGKIC
jgi:hypothetical protein